MGGLHGRGRRDALAGAPCTTAPTTHPTHPAQAVRKWCQKKVVPVLERAGARYNLHLFVDKITAPPADVASIITGVAADVGAPFLVMARSNKTRLDRVVVGSVAAEVQKGGRPVLLVQ